MPFGLRVSRTMLILAIDYYIYVSQICKQFANKSSIQLGTTDTN
jgi:hypothetical protein